MERNNSQNPTNLNGNKNLFEDLHNTGKTFEDESDEFAGEDLTLTFTIKGGNETLNGNSFQEKFKGGQDFEFVKYRVGLLLEIDPELIVLYHNDKKIIPIYSICDIEIGQDEVIIVEINE